MSKLQDKHKSISTQLEELNEELRLVEQEMFKTKVGYKKLIENCCIISWLRYDGYSVVETKRVDHYHGDTKIEWKQIENGWERLMKFPK